ncbi:MAG: hypothetical protein HLUCCO17_08530 [Saliniramus fredricksonii]|uniref:Uncharacterized protein n=2 Tax=Saliniramus fredricksonii TaxID=1653334 RepID=A0A0N8KEC4_9HYPH|nr:MAG: hypothetical protein HLUCCO17_08530 [Saliniramus fredricksonii]SCC81911.1 hypothetical protein GA0071312_2882 [Saliniramus fredricksonii]
MISLSPSQGRLASDDICQAGPHRFNAAMQAAATSDPLDPRSLSQIEKPKTDKDKDVPLDDNPGRRTNPNFVIPDEFRINPGAFLENHIQYAEIPRVMPRAGE